MSMAGYTKLFSSIIASTVWRGSKDTKILWITMLAMSDRNGVVEGSIPGLADMSRLSIPEAQAALAELLGPDEFSRTKDHEGRRIEAIDGGWAILNHAKYRAKMSTDERREYLRIKKAESRARLSTLRQQTVDKSTESTHTEAEATPKAKASPEERKRSAPARPLAEVESDQPPNGPYTGWADKCGAIWLEKRGGENWYIYDLARAFERFGETKLLKGWATYLDSFAVGAKFRGSPQNFASKAGDWCDKPAEVSLAAQGRAILERDGMILRSQP